MDKQPSLSIWHLPSAGKQPSITSAFIRTFIASVKEKMPKLGDVQHNSMLSFYERFWDYVLWGTREIKKACSTDTNYVGKNMHDEFFTVRRENHDILMYYGGFYGCGTT